MKKSFSGNVKLYNEEFYINTDTGEGMQRLFKKIDPLLTKMSKMIYLNGHTFEDLKQELSILAIEGIYAYDPSVGVKLSSFLHLHLYNKTVSKIYSANKTSRSASLLKEGTCFPNVCECGSESFYIKSKNQKDEIESIECSSCDRVYKANKKVSKREVPFSELSDRMAKSGNNPEEDVDFISTIAQPTEESPFYTGMSGINRVETLESFNMICDSVDSKTAKILQMVCLEGTTIREAAEEVGVAQWTANLRLKGLTKNKYVKEMLEK